MLIELLNLIDLGRAWSVDELAAVSGASKDKIFAEIEFLEQAGYIKRVRPCRCSGQCGSCHACEGTELLSSQPLMWEIVKK